MRRVLGRVFCIYILTTAATRLLPDPKFRITLVHHPDSSSAAAVAAQLETRFFGGAFRDESPGLGIDVSFRSEPASATASRPLPIDFSGSRCDAVVLLADEPWSMAMLSRGSWFHYIADLHSRALETNGASMVFPVALTPTAWPVHPAMNGHQHIRCYDTTDSGIRALVAELTHSFCLLLRPWVAAVENGAAFPPPAGADSPTAMKVFISHSKSDGAELAEKVRDQINQSKLKTFFDAYDILPGTTFSDVIEDSIKNSIVLVVQTDTFASREWCRREVLTARRFGVPVLVMHCVKEREARSFPYLGNVPVIVNASGSDSRVSDAVDALLAHCLESFYWRVHTKDLQALSGDPRALVLPLPPDLLTIAQCKDKPRTVVYPDPPLGHAEIEVLELAAPAVKFVTPMSLFVE